MVQIRVKQMTNQRMHYCWQTAFPVGECHFQGTKICHIFLFTGSWAQSFHLQCRTDFISGSLKSICRRPRLHISPQVDPSRWPCSLLCSPWVQDQIGCRRRESKRAVWQANNISRFPCPMYGTVHTFSQQTSSYYSAVEVVVSFVNRLLCRRPKTIFISTFFALDNVFIFSPLLQTSCKF